MKHSVLTVGNIYIKTAYGVSAPKTRGISLAESFAVEPSGFALNCADAVSRLGGEGILCCKVGNDMYGNRIKQFCDAEGITSRFLGIDKDVPTGSVVDFGSGDYTVRYDGANLNLNADELESAMLRYPDIAVIDMSVSDEVCRTAFNYANKYSVKTVASFSNLEYVSDYDYIKSIEAIILDAESTKALTGITPLSPDLCVKACIKVHYDYSPSYVVLRMGERGALSYDGKHCEFYPGIDSSEVFHSLASDAFIAAFALDYARNNSIGHACGAANIVSALTERDAENIFDLPNADKVNNFVKERELKI